MRIPLLRRLFECFTASLIGYVWGWIIGWSSFDPDLDLWALLAAVGALVGLALGLTGVFHRFGPVLLGSTCGLFIGFWMRALIFGDRSGWFGLLLSLALAALTGGWVALRQKPGGADWMPVLLAVIYAGFFGGFIIDVLVLDVLLHRISHHSILTQGMWVVLCGAAAGLIVRRVKANG